ncbi:MAG: TrkH family potassium uptake protein [Oscillospiraceae bacterium]|jgi:trk system potassium uptake protein TrkH|nr:TrkH family potassium uptake protein [Oscillospiraceae bacterium]
MNYLMIFKSLGTLCYIEAAGMLIPFGIALSGGRGGATAFLFSALITAAVGLGMSALRPKNTDIYAKDGFAVVGFGWLLVSLLGTLPFLFSGVTPSFTDALFESISGFSTTGASVLRSVESLPREILFWRSLTIWMGGLGFLVLMLAILPGARANTVHIMRAEFPGPSPDKFVPKIGQVAKILYGIYLGVTAAVFLLLLLGGMGPFDAAVHALGTASTGGFSSRSASVGAFGSAYVEGVITVFMLLSGVNFTLYYALLKRNWRPVLRDEELRLYAVTALVATALVALNLSGGVFRAPGETLRHASFQVASLLSTTGYTTADFNAWPTLSQFVLFLLTVCGATAGSTGGGLKCVRVLILFKVARREVGKLIHPRSVRAVTLNGKAVDEPTLSGVVIFFFLYVTLAAAAILALSFDGKDLLSTSSAVFASLNNIGPGLGLVEATGHYADFSTLGKLTLSLCMIVGRLEIYPVLLFCAPTFWRRVNL